MREGNSSDYDPLPIWMKIVSGTVCVLSMLGALAIILTFLLVKEIRSKARELLVHISLMDLMYSTANFVGLMLPYHTYWSPANNTNESLHHTHVTYLNVCRIQAFFAIYGTIGSVLWTLGLAVYLYYRIVSCDVKITKRLIGVLYIVCYAIPLYVSLWLLLDHHVGYSYYALSGAGWCFVNDEIHTIVLFMSYDMWMWLGLVVLIPLHLTIHFHLRNELKELKRHYLGSENPTTGAVSAEKKLLLVPIVFIFLRIWDVADDIFIVYEHKQNSHGNPTHWVKLFTAIGDSGQGFCNFIIFFLFQPRLRAMVLNVGRRCCYCCNNKSHNQGQPSRLLSEATDSYSDDEGSLHQPNNLTFSQHTPH